MRGRGSCSALMRKVHSAGRVWGTVFRRHFPLNDFNEVPLPRPNLFSRKLTSLSYFGGHKHLQCWWLSVSKSDRDFQNCWKANQVKVSEIEFERIYKNERFHFGNRTLCLSNSVYSVHTINGCRMRGARSIGALETMLIPIEISGVSPYRFYSSDGAYKQPNKEVTEDPSQRAVVTALWCNFLVFCLKGGVWLMTASHVMLAEVVHSAADFANQALLAYGLNSSRRAPDALHPYGYSKERFVWSLISAVGIFCLGAGATIVHGIQNLWIAQPPVNIFYAALVIGGSCLLEGVSLIVAVRAVRKGAAAEGMTIRDYVWRGHDPTAVAVMMEDGAAVTGLFIAGSSLVAVNVTGNPIYDPIGSILVGNLLGMIAIFLIQRNRHALIGRAIDPHDMARVLSSLSRDPVVDAVYDCKSEVIGPGSFRFKAEIGLWWQIFGSDTPDLKRFAIRILNQSCSASGCERNWSMFEKIHSKKRNRLTQKRLNDLVFVHYNLRLRNKQILGLDHSPIDLEEIDLQTTNASDWVQIEEEPPLLSLHDLENLESQASEGVGGIASSSHS